jgi:hypothetical protein
MAYASRRNVLKGRSMTRFERIGLPWDATVVQVRWLGSGKPPVDLDGLPCGVFLGSGSGVSFVLDPRNDRTLRIPSARVLISAPREREFGPVCTRAGLRRPGR